MKDAIFYLLAIVVVAFLVLSYRWSKCENGCPPSRMVGKPCTPQKCSFWSGKPEPIRTASREYQSGGVIIPSAPCKCYCSDKCGPRDIKHGIDRPFLDSETGLCFCADRDKANYAQNKCTPKSFDSSCCG